MPVLDFNERLAHKQHEAQVEEGKAVFLRVLQESTAAQQKEMFAALEEGNYERYMSVVRPLIIRVTMRDHQPGGDS